MAIVQAVAAVEDGVGGPKDVTIAATGSGNLLVVVAYSRGSTILDPPSAPTGSWVSGNDLDCEPASSMHLRIFWLPNISAGITTVTWTPVTGDNGFMVYELSEMDTVTPLDVQTAGTEATSTTPTDGDLVPTSPGACMIVGSVIPADVGGWTEGAGFTDLLTGALVQFATEAKANISASTTGTFTLAGSASWGIISVIFKVPFVAGGFGRNPQIKVYA